MLLLFFFCEQRDSFEFSGRLVLWLLLILVLSVIFLLVGMKTDSVCSDALEGRKRASCWSFNEDGLVGRSHGHDAGHFTTELVSGEPDVLFLAEISSSTSSLAGGIGAHRAGGHSHHPGDRGG